MPFFLRMNNTIRFISYIGILVGVLSVLVLAYQPGFAGPMLFDDQVNLQSAKLY